MKNNKLWDYISKDKTSKISIYKIVIKNVVIIKIVVIGVSSPDGFKEEIKFLLEYRKKQKLPLKILVDSRKQAQLDTESRKIFFNVTQDKKFVSMIAVLSTNSFINAFVNLYSKVARSDVRLFNNEDNAVKWLTK